MSEPHRGATYEQQLAMARAAEELGFAAFFRTEHFLAMEGDGRPGPTDAWVTLGALARETSSIRLGTIMTCATFRHPALLAVIVAQVDQMSGGRVDFGLGCGWFELEHHAMGVPFPPQPERFDRFEEQVEICKGLWSAPEGGLYSYAGKYYHLEGNPALPRPVQVGGPPFIVGGWGVRRTPSVAARFAAEFNSPFSSVGDSARQFARVRAACQAVGRDPDSMHYSFAIPVCCGRDDAEVARRLDRVGMSLEKFSETGVAGAPGQIVERLAAYGQVGGQRAYLQLMDIRDLDQLALIAAEVLPHV